MPKAQGLADPNAGVPQQSPQQAVPQARAGVQDRLHLAGSQDSRLLARTGELDGAPPLRPTIAEVVEERLPSRPPPTRRLELAEQVTEVDAVPDVEGVEPADRRQLPVHGAGRAVVLGRGQHRHPTAPAGRWQP